MAPQQAIEAFNQLPHSAGAHEQRVLLDYCDRNLLLPGRCAPKTPPPIMMIQYTPMRCQTTNLLHLSDLIACEPADWQPEPAHFLSKVSEPLIRQWALDVHALWKTLCRTQSDNVKCQPERHSLLAVPHPIVIPGSRFRCAAAFICPRLMRC